MSTNKVEISCPHCRRVYRLSLNPDKLARTRPQAVCARCGKRFSLVERVRDAGARWLPQEDRRNKAPKRPPITDRPAEERERRIRAAARALQEARERVTPRDRPGPPRARGAARQLPVAPATPGRSIERPGSPWKKSQPGERESARTAEFEFVEEAVMDGPDADRLPPKRDSTDEATPYAKPFDEAKPAAGSAAGGVIMTAVGVSAAGADMPPPDQTLPGIGIRPPAAIPRDLLIPAGSPTEPGVGGPPRDAGSEASDEPGEQAPDTGQPRDLRQPARKKEDGAAPTPESALGRHADPLEHPTAAELRKSPHPSERPLEPPAPRGDWIDSADPGIDTIPAVDSEGAEALEWLLTEEPAPSSR